jgi:hypothetical protein
MPATDMPDKVFKDLQTDGRALSPLACKNYPARRHPSGNKNGENFHEIVYSGRRGQSQIRGYLFVGIRFAGIRPLYRK